MNTRQRIRSDTPLANLQKASLKASLSEVQHDLQQMTDEPVKNIFPKKPRFHDLALAEPAPRAKPTARVHAGKAVELVSAILGFSSFINELEYFEISDKPAKKPKKKPKPPAPRIKNVIPQNTALPPFLVTQTCSSAYPAQLAARSFFKPLPVSRVGAVPRELPHSATHLKIARLVQAWLASN